MVSDLDVDDVDFAAMTDENVNVVDLENQAGEAPVVKLCNAILLSAIKKKASDIHIEPYEKSISRAVPRRRRAAPRDGGRRSS